MNPASTWRLQFARYVAEAYAAEPDVAAVLIGGSAARGHADQHSDVEVGVFWDHPPTREQRQRVAGRVMADGKSIFPFDQAEQLWSEDYFVGRAQPDAEMTGLLVEVAGYTSEHFQQVAEVVLRGNDPDPLKQNLISGVMQSVVVKNQEIVDSWREECAVYPDSLARSVVLRYGQIDHYWRWRMWLDRGNRLMFDHQMYEVRQRLLHMLLAVNRIYFFGFKWLPVVFDRLDCAPRDFADRFVSIDEAVPESVAECLGELVEETFSLVESRVPDVSVERLRSIFRWERPKWGDQPPPIHPSLPTAS